MEDVLKQPVISVIMSVYNEPIEWITQSINSILNQTFNNYEFIIVNDNPVRRENVDLLESFAKSDSRIKIIHNQTNLGLPASLNKAISQAQGKYVARMDADDISLSNRFQLQYDFLEKNTEYGICGTYACQLDENSKVGKKIKLGYTDEELKARLLFYSPFLHPSVMVRKNLILELKYDESFRVAQDVELWLRMSMVTKFYNIPQVLLYYRHVLSSRKREQTDLQRKIYDNLAYKRFEHFIPMSTDKEMKMLFVSFTQPIENRKKHENTNILFHFLLSKLGNNKYCYQVLFQRYIREQLDNKSYVGAIYNPFLSFSFCKYLNSVINYLWRKFC